MNSILSLLPGRARARPGGPRAPLRPRVDARRGAAAGGRARGFARGPRALRPLAEAPGRARHAAPRGPAAARGAQKECKLA